MSTLLRSATARKQGKQGHPTSAGPWSTGDSISINGKIRYSLAKKPGASETADAIELIYILYKQYTKY
jgi:hypothetical protein